MELRNYVQILFKRWWLILPLTLIALTAGMIFSFSRPPIYESVSTYVTTFKGQTGVGDTIYALDTLTQRERVFATYCQVMMSQSVFDKAIRLGSIDPAVVKLTDYGVNCTVLPQANVLQVTVSGPVPAVVQRLNEAVGLSGIASSDAIYPYFGLEVLDKARVEPTTSNQVQQGILGGLVGLALSVTLAFMLEYLRSPAEKMEMLSIRHPKLGIYNERYFQQRLAEEINRARIRHRPLSIGLMRLIANEDFALLPEAIRDNLQRAVALRLSDKMREGDIVAYLGSNTFAIMLPETPGHEAQTVIERLQAEVRGQTYQFDAYSTNFNANTGIVESSGGILDLKAMLAKASEALLVADRAGENSVHLIRTSAPAFSIEEMSGEEEEITFPPLEAGGANSPFTSSELEEMLARPNAETEGEGAAAPGNGVTVVESTAPERSQA